MIPERAVFNREVKYVIGSEYGVRIYGDPEHPGKNAWFMIVRYTGHIECIIGRGAVQSNFNSRLSMQPYVVFDTIDEIAIIQIAFSVTQSYLEINGLELTTGEKYA